MCFGQKTKTQQAQQSTQSGTSQSNIYDNPMFQNSMGNFFSQFSQPNISGVTTAPTGYQTSAADSLVGALGANGAASLISQSGLTPEAIQAQMSPYINAVVNPTMAAQAQQNQQALSQLKGNMGTRGSLGNNTGAQAAYLAGVTPGQNAVIGNLYNQGWLGAAQTALQSQNQQLQASGMLNTTAGTLGQLGEQIRQAKLQGQTLPFQLQSQLSTSLAPWLQAAGVNFSGESEGTSSGTSTTTPGIGNTIAGLLGAALQFSDPRLKERRRQIGTTFDGQPLYAFNFKPGLGMGSETRIGLDATEVARRDPGAVLDTPIGMAVNYDRALVPAEAAASNGGAVAGGGDDVMNKVARAFNMIRGMRREAMKDGGGLPAYALGGLLPSTTSLGISPGGWDTSVATPGALNLSGGGKGLSALGNLGGDPAAGEQMMRQGSAAMGQQQAALSAMLQQAMGGGRAEGGRVGYEDGGVSDEGWAPLGFGEAGTMGGARAAGAPREGFAVPALAEAAGRIGAHRPTLGAPIGRPEFVPPPPAVPPVEDYRREPYSDATAVAGNPAWDFNAPNYPAEAVPPSPDQRGAITREGWSPVVQAEPGPPAAAPVRSWLERVGRALFPTAYGEGLYHNMAPTAAQNLGIGLLAMSGPMVGAGWATAAMGMREALNKERELERQTASLNQQMEHQRATLAETTRHNQRTEEHPAVRALIAAGFTPGTPEFQRQLLKILDKDKAESAFTVAGANAAVKLRTDMGTAINTDREQVRNLDTLERLLSAPGVAEGKFAHWTTEGRRVLAALGATNTEGIPESEAANAITNQLTLMARSTGAGMPGAMSDADRIFLGQMVPSLTQTAAGRTLLIKVMRDAARYRMDANAEAIRHINETGSDATVSEHMTRWMAAHPMESVVPGHRQVREQAEAAVAATPSPPPTAGALPTAPGSEVTLSRDLRRPDGTVIPSGTVVVRQPDGTWLPRPAGAPAEGSLAADPAFNTVHGAP